MTVEQIAKLTGRTEGVVRSWIYEAAAKEKNSKLLEINVSKTPDFNTEYLFKILKAGLGEQIASAYMMSININSFVSIGNVAESFNKISQEFSDFKSKISEDMEELKELVIETGNKSNSPFLSKNAEPNTECQARFELKVDLPKPRLSLFMVKRIRVENRIGVRFFSIDRPEIKAGERYNLCISGKRLILKKNLSEVGYNILSVNKGRGLAFNGFIERELQPSLNIDLVNNIRYLMEGEIVNGEIHFNLDELKVEEIH